MGRFTKPELPILYHQTNRQPCFIWPTSQTQNVAKLNEQNEHTLEKVKGSMMCGAQTLNHTRMMCKASLLLNSAQILNLQSWHHLRGLATYLVELTQPPPAVVRFPKLTTSRNWNWRLLHRIWDRNRCWEYMCTYNLSCSQWPHVETGGLCAQEKLSRTPRESPNGTSSPTI